MKAFVDNTCTACGLCVSICPEVFELDGEIADVIVDEIPDELQTVCREAAESCPVEAIRIEE